MTSHTEIPKSWLASYEEGPVELRPKHEVYSGGTIAIVYSAISGNGRVAAVTYGPNDVKFVDTCTNGELARIQATSSFQVVEKIGLSYYGTEVAVALSDGTVRVWKRSKQGKLFDTVRDIKPPKNCVRVQWLSFDNAHDRLLISFQRELTSSFVLEAYHLHTEIREELHSGTGRLVAVASSSDGGMIAYAVHNEARPSEETNQGQVEYRLHTVVLSSTATDFPKPTHFLGVAERDDSTTDGVGLAIDASGSAVCVADRNSVRLWRKTNHTSWETEPLVLEREEPLLEPGTPPGVGLFQSFSPLKKRPICSYCAVQKRENEYVVAWNTGQGTVKIAVVAADTPTHKLMWATTDGMNEVSGCVLSDDCERLVVADKRRSYIYSLPPKSAPDNFLAHLLQLSAQNDLSLSPVRPGGDIESRVLQAPSYGLDPSKIDATGSTTPGSVVTINRADTLLSARPAKHLQGIAEPGKTWSSCGQRTRSTTSVLVPEWPGLPKPDSASTPVAPESSSALTNGHDLHIQAVVTSGDAGHVPSRQTIAGKRIRMLRCHVVEVGTDKGSAESKVATLCETLFVCLELHDETKVKEVLTHKHWRLQFLAERTVTTMDMNWRKTSELFTKLFLSDEMTTGKVVQKVEKLAPALVAYVAGKLETYDPDERYKRMEGQSDMTAKRKRDALYQRYKAFVDYHLNMHGGHPSLANVLILHVVLYLVQEKKQGAMAELIELLSARFKFNDFRKAVEPARRTVLNCVASVLTMVGQLRGMHYDVPSSNVQPPRWEDVNMWVSRCIADLVRSQHLDVTATTGDIIPGTELADAGQPLPAEDGDSGEPAKKRVRRDSFETEQADGGSLDEITPVDAPVSDEAHSILTPKSARKKGRSTASEDKLLSVPGDSHVLWSGQVSGSDAEDALRELDKCMTWRKGNAAT